ncbi:MAG: hypothetical protein AAFV19_02300 [Pseudomonadota bacterium]
MTKASFFTFRRGAPASIGFAAVLALSACADGGSDTTTATASTQQPAATAQQGTPQASTGQATTPRKRINISNCSQPADEKVFFKVGGARLGVPSGVIVEAIPSTLRPPIRKEDATRELERQAANGAGCPEAPLDTVLLVINDRFAHPLLEGTAGLVRATPGMTEQFAALTEKLQQEPTNNCRELSGDLLACVGTETLRNRETPVMYVITTDRSQKLNTGGPLAARCTLQERKIQGCNLIDTLPGDLTVDVTLNPGTYTTADLAGARSAALRQIQGYAR